MGILWVYLYFWKYCDGIMGDDDIRILYSTMLFIYVYRIALKINLPLYLDCTSQNTRHSDTSGYL